MEKTKALTGKVPWQIIGRNTLICVPLSKVQRSFVESLYQKGSQQDTDVPLKVR